MHYEHDEDMKKYLHDLENSEKTTRRCYDDSKVSKIMYENRKKTSFCKKMQNFFQANMVFLMLALAKYIFEIFYFQK